MDEVSKTRSGELRSTGVQKKETGEKAELGLFQVKVKADPTHAEEQFLYVQAYTPEQIHSEYRAKGYEILGIRELVSKGPVTFAKINLEEKAQFCYLLAHLLKAGIPFKQALNTILSETSRGIAQAIPAIIQDLDKGRSVIDSLERHPGIFDPVMLAVLQTGEKSGEWSNPLIILAENFERHSNLKNSVKLALLYPLIVLVIAVLIVVALSIYAFPNFMRIYSELRVPVPWPTQLTLGVVMFLLSKWGVLFAVLIVALGCIVWRLYRTEQGKLMFQSILLRTGTIGKILESQSIAIFSRTLSILLGAGGLLHDSLITAARSTTLEKHRRALMGMVAPIRKGEDPAVTLDKNFAFTQTFKQQFVVGVTTGQLDNSLARIAEFYEKELLRQITKLTKVVEPFIIVILGIVIAWLVVSMYLPLFHLLSAVR